MIEFHCKRHHPSDNTPIVYDSEIQEYAETVLGDYKPKLLKEAGKINALHFLESYCGADVDYQDIYYEENEDPIAGAAVFNEGYVKVFDRENMRTKPLKVRANTVLIDNQTMKEGKEAFALFTELHEGGHILIHPCVYRKISNQLSLFDFGLDMMEDKQHTVMCCRSAIGKSEKVERPKLETQEDFREHQANTFAASLAMPRATFIPYAKGLIRQYGFNYGIWVQKEYYDWDDEIGFGIALEDVCEQISNVYGVSKSAARVHLKRNKLLMDEQEYMKEHRQMAIVF